MQPRRIYLVYWGTVPVASTARREGCWSCDQHLFPLWLLDRRKEINQEVTVETGRHSIVAQLSSGETGEIEVQILGAFGVQTVNSKSKVSSLRVARKWGTLPASQLLGLSLHQIP